MRLSDVTDSRIIDAMLAIPREVIRSGGTASACLSDSGYRRQRGRPGQALPVEAGGDG